jgi:hypothetical protein
LTQGEAGRALDKIAGFVGTSRFTLKKAEDIVEAAEKELELYQICATKIA